MNENPQLPQNADANEYSKEYEAAMLQHFNLSEPLSAEALFRARESHAIQVNRFRSMLMGEDMQHPEQRMRVITQFAIFKCRYEWLKRKLSEVVRQSQNPLESERQSVRHLAKKALKGTDPRLRAEDLVGISLDLFLETLRKMGAQVDEQPDGGIIRYRIHFGGRKNRMDYFPNFRISKDKANENRGSMANVLYGLGITAEAFFQVLAAD